MEKVHNNHFAVQKNFAKGSGYHKTMQRFNSILDNKIGRKPAQGVVLPAVKKMDTNSVAIQSLSQASNNDLRFNTRILEKFDAAKATGNLEMRKPVASSKQPVSEYVLSDSGNSAEVINSKLNGTALAGLGSVFKDAEKRTGVNAYLLAAIAIHESAYGSSKIAQDKNNLFGFQAYDDSPYESAKSYSNFSDSIYDVAKHLSKNYLQKDGDYFNGYSIDAIGQSYASDPRWAAKVKNFVNKLQS